MRGSGTRGAKRDAANTARAAMATVAVITRTTELLLGVCFIDVTLQSADEITLRLLLLGARAAVGRLASAMAALIPAPRAFDGHQRPPTRTRLLLRDNPVLAEGLATLQDTSQFQSQRDRRRKRHQEHRRR